MKRLRQSALTLALLLVASTAFAGGRPSTTIVVKNRSAGPICAAIDAASAATIADLIAAGGQYINAGSSRSFKVDAGSHTVYVVDAVNPVFPATEISAYVHKHCRKKVVYQGTETQPDTAGASLN